MLPNGTMRAQIGTLIIATSCIQIGNGFFGTFISLRVALEDFEATAAGLVLSSYFVGFTIGALRCGKIIARIGHIRAYAAFAGLAVTATAAMPLLIGALPWLILRGVIGFGCAGLFVTAESWLNAKVEPAERGRAFSIYMVGTFVALALGQLLIGQVEVATAAPFSLIAVLFALALVMVSTTRAEAPVRGAVPALRAAPARRPRRRRRLRAERGYHQRVLCARAGLDAGRGYRTVDDRILHARGRARWPRLPGSGRPILGPIRPAHRAGGAWPRLRGHRRRRGLSAAQSGGGAAGRGAAGGLHVEPLSGLRRQRA